MSTSNLPPIEPLLTIRDVMRILRVARNTPYRWHTRGELRAVELPGNTLRWRASDIEALVAAKSTGKA